MDNSKNNEEKLKEALRKLTEAADKIQNNQGYSNETNRVRLLAELIREQLPQ
jgi:hypothetical protein